jgi:hypothetical protein
MGFDARTILPVAFGYLTARVLKELGVTPLDTMALLVVLACALKALHRRCADVRYLGSWPTGSAAGAVPPQLDEAARWLMQLREGKP